jgi:hypothetical protein
MRCPLWYVIGGLSLLVWPVGVRAQPKPSPVPVSWELDFEFEDPQRISVQLPGHDEPQTFWYVLYRVENNTGAERIFFPTFEIVTRREEYVERDDGNVGVVPGGWQTYRADQDIHPLVFRAIKKRHGLAWPFLIEPVQALGRLLQGEDNARTSVAIWRQFDPHADSFILYIGGLSGETAQVVNPDYDKTRPEEVVEDLGDGIQVPRIVNPKVYSLRKTLAVEYDLPGDPATRREVEPIRRSQYWVMR